MGHWDDDSEPFVGSNMRSYSHFLLHSSRFGSYLSHRGLRTSFAYIKNRTPVRIHHIFHVSHARQDRHLDDLQASFALVERFISDEDIPVMPWNFRYAPDRLAQWQSLAYLD